jgi:hypothetical protein
VSRYLKTEDLTHNLVMDAQKDLFYRAIKSVVWYPVEVNMYALGICAINRMEGFQNLGICAINRMEGFQNLGAIAFNKMEGFTGFGLVAFVSGLTTE